MYKKRFIICLILLFVGSFLLPFSLHADESKNVTASLTIPPGVSNFQFQFSPLDKQQTNIPAGVTQTYQITYGALNTAVSSTNTLTVDFNDDKILGIDVLDYVLGSATDAINGTHPVIDLINHTITWTFTLPTNTPDQTVSFQLRTNDHYTGDTVVPFNITARMQNEFATLPLQKVTQTYSHNGALATAPQTTSITPTPQISLTPTPTTKPVEPSLLNVSFTNITNSTSAIQVNTSNPSSVVLLYGLSPTNLTQKVISTTIQKETTLQMQNLQPSTTYYFKVITASASGSVTSEIFTLKTAQISLVPEVDQLVITSSDNVLYAPALVGSQTSIGLPQIVLPKDIPYQLTIRIKNSENIATVHAILINQILAFTGPTFADGAVFEAPVTQTDAGVYTVTLTTPKIKSLYEVLLKITDKKGNFVQKKIAELKSASPLFVFENGNNKTIEHARVLFFKLNENTHKYTQLPLTQSFANPEYSDNDGAVTPVLQKGTYKVNVSALGYTDKTVTFALGTEKNQDFPIVYLIKKPFSIATTANFFLTTIVDTLLATREYVLGLSGSVRFFELNALLVTAIFIFITLIAFSERIHIPFLSLPAYFLHLGQIRFLQKKLMGKIYGKLINRDTNQAIPGATVYLIDSKKKMVLGHTKSTAEGKFSFATLTSNNYILNVLKEGFRPTFIDQSEIRATGEEGYILTIHEHLNKEAIHEQVEQYFKKVLSLLFETTLLISFVFELAIAFTFGMNKAILFLCLSAGNVFLWILHMTHLHGSRHSL